MGLKNVSILAVPHPLGAGLPEDKVREKAENAVEELIKRLTEQL